MESTALRVPPFLRPSVSAFPGVDFPCRRLSPRIINAHKKPSSTQKMAAQETALSAQPQKERSMTRKTIAMTAVFVLTAAGSASAQSHSLAKWCRSHDASAAECREIRRDTREIRADRREIRSDRREIHRDIRHGDKREARQDIRELRRDQRDLARDKRDRRRDIRDLRRD